MVTLTDLKEALREILGFGAEEIGREGVTDALEKTLDLHSSFAWNKFLEEGVDAHFNARIVNRAMLNISVDPSDYWVQSEYVYPFVGYIRNLVGNRLVAIHSRRCFNNPILSARTTLPTLVSNDFVYIGLENDKEGGNGVITFLWGIVAGVETLRVACGATLPWSFADITALLPANFKTVFHKYQIVATDSIAEFYIDDSLVALGIMSPNTSFTSINGPPYALFASDAPVSPNLMSVLKLAVRSETQVDLPLSPYGFRISDGKGIFSRVYRLYNAGTNTLWAGMSVSNGVTVTSHPFPLFGYEGKTVDFEATCAGTLFIDVLLQTDNWAEYPPNAGTAIVANVLENFPITGDEVIGRLRFTPGADGTITDAEVHLR